QRRRDQHFGIRPRDEDPPVDAEGPSVELALPEDVGDGFAGTPPLDELAEARKLRRLERALRVDEELNARRAAGEGAEKLCVEARRVDPAPPEVVGGPA